MIESITKFRGVVAGLLLLAALVGAGGMAAGKWSHAARTLATPIHVLPPHPAPAVGQLAPDFELPTPDGRRVRLSHFRGSRPVALIFASMTCPYFRDEAQALERLYQQYGNQVEFLMVYQQEAHPFEDGYAFEAAAVDENAADGIRICRPQSLAERCQLCQESREKLSLTIPAVVDKIDDRVAYDYMSTPVKLLLVDASGKIAFQSAPGPWSFRAQDLKRAITGLLAAAR